MDLRLAFAERGLSGDAPVKVNCFRPSHQDDTASLAIYPDHLHCYGCGWHLGPRQAAEAIAAYCGIPVRDLLGDDGYVAHRQSTPRKTVTDLRAEPLPYTELAEPYAWLHYGQPGLDAWLRERGLTAETIERAGIGHDGWRFVIPVQARDGNVLTLRYRIDPEHVREDYTGPKYLGYKGRNGLLLYGEYLVAADTDWLVLCEGELDALRLWQETYEPKVGQEPRHYPAISATNGASQMERLIALIHEVFPKVAHVVIASDQDRAGHQAARDTALALQRAGFTWERAFWDTGKDVTEYLQSGGPPHLFLPQPERRGNLADIILHLAHSILQHSQTSDA